jgi:tRNA pseudouridine55 synthase
VDGILLLDKPGGLRSNAVLQRIKWLFQARKAGHTGALDNMASGCLPICLGEATKLSQFLLDADKRYVTTLKLGVSTDTGDADGQVTARAPVAPLDPALLERTLETFRGRITQVPPMFSALKRDGRRLHELAYQGKEVEREARPVTVHTLRCLRIAPAELELEVLCSKGTYIRVLGEEIGSALGCGAHLSMLRRLQVGPFDDGQLVTLEQAEEASMRGLDALDALLLPMDRALDGLPARHLDAESAALLRHGQALRGQHPAQPGTPCAAPAGPVAAHGLVRLYDGEGGFMGIGELRDDGALAPRRLLATAELAR